MNSNLLSGNLSYPGHWHPHMLHSDRLFVLLRTSISIVGSSTPSTQRTVSYTNDLIFCTRFKILLSCILPPLLCLMVVLHFHLDRVGAGCATFTAPDSLLFYADSLFFYPQIILKSQILINLKKVSAIACSSPIDCYGFISLLLPMLYMTSRFREHRKIDFFLLQVIFQFLLF